MTIFRVFCALAAITSVVAQTEKNRPVTKVIKILENMAQQLQKDAENDEAIYAKMACWCKTNDKEKTQSIKDAESSIAQLSTSIEEYTATSSKLSTEIGQLEKSLAENQKALAEATEMRKKQLAEFNAEEKDLLQSIKALKAAITTLSKHHGGSFLQVKKSHIAGVAASIMNVMELHSNLLDGVLSSDQRDVLTEFAQDPSRGPIHGDSSYAPQSGQIFGILQTLLESFENNLSASQKEELKNSASFQDLKAAKEEEIQATSDQKDDKTEEKATTDGKNSQAKEDIENTKESLSSDEQFLMELKQKCQMSDQEWEARQKTRTEEQAAVAKALEILSGDDAHNLFTRTFNFIQKTSVVKSKARDEASSLLQSVADKTNNPRLSNLAMKVKLDAFTKVKKAIDDMIAALLKQKDDEIKQKDYCIAEHDQNEKQQIKKQNDKQDTNSRIEDLEVNKAQLETENSNLEAEIAEANKQLKKASENRDDQNKEFQADVADNTDTIAVLGKALKALEAFYKPALVQEAGGPPAPAGFDSYKNQQHSGGVMGMLQQIMADCERVVDELTRDEKELQETYDSFVRDTTKSNEAKNRQIVSNKEAIGKMETDLAENKNTLDGLIFDIEQLGNYKAELHQQCDFLQQNFEIRQTAFDDEVKALRQAKAILSGMS